MKFKTSKKVLEDLGVQLIMADLPEVISISTDTRTYAGQALFIALAGANFDGFAFAEDVAEAGARAIVFNDNSDNRQRCKTLVSRFPKTQFLPVPDTIIFLQELSNAHLKSWKEGRLIVGITGSNGKTTNKEMLAHLLEPIFKDSLLYTEGNLNNHIGVPLTLLRLEEKHQLVIVEMGTSNFGEIQRLCDIAEPNCGMITSIGASHLEFLINEENVFKEKRALFDYVVKQSPGYFVCNYDDKFLRRLSGENVQSFGCSNGDLRVSFDDITAKVTGDSLDFSFNRENLLGAHNVLNMVGCILLAKRISGNLSTVLEQAGSYIQKQNRGQQIKWQNKQVFLDAYNANPSSMLASVEGYCEFLNNHNIPVDESFFVLGDMNELGDQAARYHEEMGRKLVDLGIKNAAFVGRYCESYLKGFNGGHSFKTVEELRGKWADLCEGYSNIFIKASRSLQLEQLVDIN